MAIAYTSCYHFGFLNKNKMKIKKQWLIFFNGYLTKIVKTKNGYFIEEQTNLTAYVPIMKDIAKQYIERTKAMYGKDGFYANIKNPSDLFGDCIISDLPDTQAE